MDRELEIIKKAIEEEVDEILFNAENKIYEKDGGNDEQQKS